MTQQKECRIVFLSNTMSTAPLSPGPDSGSESDVPDYSSWSLPQGSLSSAAPVKKVPEAEDGVEDTSDSDVPDYSSWNYKPASSSTPQPRAAPLRVTQPAARAVETSEEEEDQVPVRQMPKTSPSMPEVNTESDDGSDTVPDFSSWQPPRTKHAPADHLHKVYPDINKAK